MVEINQIFFVRAIEVVEKHPGIQDIRMGSRSELGRGPIPDGENSQVNPRRRYLACAASQLEELLVRLCFIVRYRSMCSQETRHYLWEAYYIGIRLNIFLKTLFVADSFVVIHNVLDYDASDLLDFGDLFFGEFGQGGEFNLRDVLLVNWNKKVTRGR